MPTWNDAFTAPAGIRISASVSCMDLCHLETQIREVEKAGVSFFHYDVVDGRFNNCFILGETGLEKMRPVTSLPIEVHLAAYEPEKYIERFAKCGADILTVHYESMQNPHRIFEQIRSLGCRPALAYKSTTEAGADFIDLAGDVSMILKLTVSPGFSGQKMQPQAAAHIRAMRKLLDQAGLNVPIQADGNISLTTIPSVVRAGATILTGGTSGLFTGEKTIAENASDLYRAARGSLA